MPNWFRSSKIQIRIKGTKYFNQQQQLIYTYLTNFYSFENKDLPDWYKDKEPKSEPGQSNGLRLVLDAHSDLISPGTVFDNFKGFITVVGDKTSFPLTKRTGFLLKPGRENHIALSATSVVSDEGIRSIDPKKRHCYFFDEYSLKLHKNYSQANCIIECNTKYARELMESKCTPWYFPGRCSYFNLRDC